MASFENDVHFILESLGDLFRDDELRPGLTLSLLEDGQTYASVVRWPRRDIKHVALSTRQKSTKKAAEDLRAKLVRYVAEGRHEIPYLPSTPPAPTTTPTNAAPSSGQRAIPQSSATKPNWRFDPREAPIMDASEMDR